MRLYTRITVCFLPLIPEPHSSPSISCCFYYCCSRHRVRGGVHPGPVARANTLTVTPTYPRTQRTRTDTGGTPPDPGNRTGGLHHSTTLQHDSKCSNKRTSNKMCVFHYRHFIPMLFEKFLFHCGFVQISNFTAGLSLFMKSFLFHNPFPASCSCQYLEKGHYEIKPDLRI